MRSSCPSCGSNTALGDVHCFKCGHVNAQYRSVKGKILPIKFHERQIDAMHYIFNPKQFHPQALEWLNRAYFTDEMIFEYGIAYLPNTHQVGIPFYDAYILKNFDVTKPKYIVKGNIKESQKKCIDYMIPHTGCSLIIVEDVLSYLRLSSTENCLPLLGTQLNNDILDLILPFSPIVLWLDSDAPGLKAKTKLLNKLKALETKNITRREFITDDTTNTINRFYQVNHAIINKDPKLYTNSEIQSILKENIIYA